MSKHPFATVAVGLIASLAIVALEMLLGPPGGLEPLSGAAQFPIVLAVNALLVLAPFLYASLRSGGDAGVVPDIGSVVALSVAAAVSVVASLMLWMGIGFTFFLVVHILLIVGLAILWLGLKSVRSLSQAGDERSSLTRTRRASVDEALIGLESDCMSLPSAQSDRLRRVLGDLRDEVRLLTPRQLDGSPSRTVQIWAAIESLGAAVVAAKQQSGNARLDEAVAQARGVVALLRQASV